MTLRTLPDRRCRSCGQMYRPRDVTRQFCSRDCAYDWSRGPRAALQRRLRGLWATITDLGGAVEHRPLAALEEGELRAMCAAEAERVRVLSSAEGAYYRQTHQGAA